MRTLPKDEKRLELLNEAQPGRPWRSCDEKRRCVVCESIFRGTRAIVHWPRQRPVRLACPTCGAGPALWVRLGNPLIDKQAWADWESAMELAAGDADDDLLAAS